MRRPVYATALGMLLLAILFFGIRYQQAAAFRSRTLEAAERGAAWLLAQEIPLRDPGILWIVSAINEEYCQDARISEFVAKRFEEFDGRPNPVYPALRGLALGTREQHFDDFYERWTNRRHKGDVVAAMAYGVYCDRVPMPDAVEKTVFATTSHGYELTHQFLTLLYMKRNGCLADQTTLTRAARAIAEEQAHDPVFSDLSAERVAVLLHGGFRELVQTSWLEALVAKQQPSGAWSDPDFSKRLYPSAENPHTTVLGLWALTEHSRACPFR